MKAVSHYLNERASGQGVRRARLRALRRVMFHSDDDVRITQIVEAAAKVAERFVTLSIEGD